MYRYIIIMIRCVHGIYTSISITGYAINKNDIFNILHIATYAKFWSSRILSPQTPWHSFVRNGIYTCQVQVKFHCQFFGIKNILDFSTLQITGYVMKGHARNSMIRLQQVDKDFLQGLLPSAPVLLKMIIVQQEPSLQCM